MLQVDGVEVRLVRSPVSEYDSTAKLNTPERVFEVLRPLYEGLTREVVRAVYMNSTAGIIGTAIVSMGTADQSLVHAREVFGPALVIGATRVILVHNHPSGDLTPSPADVALTKDMKKAGKILDIELLDHVIMGDNSYSSMREGGFV